MLKIIVSEMPISLLKLIIKKLLKLITGINAS